MRYIPLIIMLALFASAAYATIPTPNYWYKADATNITGSSWKSTYTSVSNRLYAGYGNWTEQAKGPKNIEHSVYALQADNDNLRMVPLKVAKTNTDFSIAFWANFTSGQSVENSNGYAFTINTKCATGAEIGFKVRSSGNARVELYQGGNSTPTFSLHHHFNAYDSKWHHYVITYNTTQDTWRIFIDGTNRNTSNSYQLNLIGPSLNPNRAGTFMSDWQASSCAGDPYSATTGSITDIRIWNSTLLTYGQVMEVYKSNTSSAPPAPNATLTNITITKPTASQQIVNQTTFVRFIVDGNKSSYEVNITKDGVYQGFVNVSNNTYKNVWLNYTEGAHTVLLKLRNNLAVHDSIAFSTMHFNISDYDQPANQYELSNVGSNITIEAAAGCSVWRVIGMFVPSNGTASNHTAAYTGGKWQITYLTPFINPGPLTSNTIWYTSMTCNATNQTNMTIGTPFTINYGFLASVQSISTNRVWEGGYTTHVVYFRNYTDSPATVIVRHMFNGSTYRTLTNHSVPISAINHTDTARIYAPELGRRNTTMLANAQINFSYGGLTRQVSVGGSDNARIYRVNVSYVWNVGAGYRAFIVNTKDESDNTYLRNSTFNLQVTAWKNSSITQNFSFTLYKASYSNASLKTSPRNGTTGLYIDAVVTASLTNYSDGSLTVNDRLINSTLPSRYDIYLINATKGDLVILQALGAVDTPLADYIINVQKYFYSLGAYVSVYSARTDVNGRVVPSLDWYTTYYTILVSYPNGTVKKQFNPLLIVESPTLLRTAEGTEGFANVYYGIQSNCTYTNTTKILRCTVTDPAGTVTYARLKVWADSIWPTATDCDTTASGSAVTLVCGLNTSTATNFNYVLTAYVPGGSWHELEIGNILGLGTPGSLALGESGALALVLLVIVAGVIGLDMAGAIGAIAFSAIAFIVGSLFNLYPLGGAQAMILIILALIGVFLLRRN